MSIFGWSYPAGAANDPLAPYNQGAEPCEVCGLETEGAEEDGCKCPACPVCGVTGEKQCIGTHLPLREIASAAWGYEPNVDPYGILTFVVGRGDDFVCFDYEVTDAGVYLASCLNSETGSFIQDFQETFLVKWSEAYSAAQGLVDAALEWCGENDVAHDNAGWNQDPYYFARRVQEAVERHLGTKYREVERDIERE